MLTRARLVLLLLLACAKTTPTLPTCEGDLLFGAPNAKTGLDSSSCGRGACTCGGKAFEPKTWSLADLNALRAFRLTKPFDEVTSDPYATPPAPVSVPVDAVCGVVSEGNGAYHLADFDSVEAAFKAGAEPTHSGRCGVCSTLTDLAVYAGKPDLTAPVRDCGLNYLGAPMEQHVQCLRDLGFTLPCAQIWYWNTLHTRDACSSLCFAAIDDPYNKPDGGLNPCLQCDEDHSGVVFKAVAGRTRRNTGVPSSMCRPCSETRPFTHEY